MSPVVTIKQRITDHPFTEYFVEYLGRTFYTRNHLLVADTPHVRAQIAQQFLDRLRRYPSGVVADAAYDAQQTRVERALNARGDLIEPDKNVKPRRPTPLSIVKDQ